MVASPAEVSTLRLDTMDAGMVTVLVPLPTRLKEKGFKAPEADSTTCSHQLLSPFCNMK